MKVTLVWAMDKNWLVGNDDKLPWHYPEDLKFFKKLTKGKVVLMGLATYLSMKSYYKNKELPFHIIYVADLNNGVYDDAITVTNIDWFFESLKEDIIVIGGSTIYTLSLPYADELYITHIDAEHEGNIYMKKFDIDADFDLEKSDVSGILTFNKYVRKKVWVI